MKLTEGDPPLVERVRHEDAAIGDLFGGHYVQATSQVNASEVLSQRASSSRGLKRSSPAVRLSKAELGERLDAFARLLATYCRFELGFGQPDSHQTSMMDVASSQMFEALVDDFLALVLPGGTIGESRRRLVVKQSLMMAGGKKLAGGRSTPRQNVVFSVPTALHPYLDYSVGSFFATAPKGDAIAAALYGANICWVGNLIEMTEDAVTQVLREPQLLSAAINELAEVGLSLGMSAPLWRKQRRTA